MTVESISGHIPKQNGHYPAFNGWIFMFEQEWHVAIWIQAITNPLYRLYNISIRQRMTRIGQNPGHTGKWPNLGPRSSILGDAMNWVKTSVVTKYRKSWLNWIFMVFEESKAFCELECKMKILKLHSSEVSSRFKQFNRIPSRTSDSRTATQFCGPSYS